MIKSEAICLPGRTLLPRDLDTCLAYLPIRVVNTLKEWPNRACVAGGFIRSTIRREEPKDIDIFVDSEVTAGRIADSLAAMHKIVSTGKALTVQGYGGPAPQVIYKWVFPHPKYVIDTFDFTVVQACIWWDGNSWMSKVHRNFYEDLETSRLVYTSPKHNDPLGTFLRVLKFYRAGYAIDNVNLSKVLADLCHEVSDCEVSRPDFYERFLSRLPARGNGKY